MQEVLHQLEFLFHMILEGHLDLKKASHQKSLVKLEDMKNDKIYGCITESERLLAAGQLLTESSLDNLIINY